MSKKNHDHKKPVTRRDFLSAGLTTGAGYIIMPTMLDILLNSAIAQAACAPPGATNTMPALITIDAAGGACFAWDIPPLDVGENVLSSYGKLGLGNQATAVAGMTAAPFANVIQRSGPGTLIPQIQTILAGNSAAILSRTTCIPIWSSSRDDSSTVGNGIQTAVVNAGLAGKIKLLGTNNSATGIPNVDAFNLAKITPFVPNSVTDVVNSLGSPASGAFGKLAQGKKDATMRIIKNLNEHEARKLASVSGGLTASELISCAHDQNALTVTQPPTGDARTSPIATAWGITAATNAGAQDAVRASMVLAALTGNSGPVGIEMGGYDYHGNGQANQDTKHRDLGTLIARILSSAKLLSDAGQMNRDLVIWLITDGATDTADSATVGAPRGDSGENGGNILLMYKATGNVPTTTKKQIGYFNNSQQNAPGSPSESIQMGALSAFLNYLAFAGGQTKVDTWTSILPGISLTQAQKDALIALNLS